MECFLYFLTKLKIEVLFLPFDSFEKYPFTHSCVIYFVVLQWKVRRTLAFSIHELALVLGSEITRIELVPTFNSFLKDLDEVRTK